MLLRDRRQRVEDLAIEQFVTQAGIEALDVAVLPGTAWLDVGGFRADCADPVLNCCGHELRAVIGSDVTRHAAKDPRSVYLCANSGHTCLRDLRLLGLATEVLQTHILRPQLLHNGSLSRPAQPPASRVSDQFR